MKTDILTALADGPLTFAALSDALGDLGGDRAITPNTDRNVVYWNGMSEPFAEAVQSLRAAGLIEFDSWWPVCLGVAAYMEDGCRLLLPLADDPPVGRYLTPHWFPVMVGRT